jgi:hypothetical protein
MHNLESAMILNTDLPIFFLFFFFFGATAQLGLKLAHFLDF